jgi:hypothetical protein
MGMGRSLKTTVLQAVAKDDAADVCQGHSRASDPQPYVQALITRQIDRVALTTLFLAFLRVPIRQPQS